MRPDEVDRTGFADDADLVAPGDPGDPGDYADEHGDLTFADDVPGGPERAEEPESPAGHSGMD
jgi:hypothetical protein